jgi:serine/threonine-protein kinase
MGTPLYMSPEQVEGQAVDTRSDIYSLGVTCFHVLAGRPPYQGDTPLNIAVQHLNSEPPRLEDLRSDLPGALCRIVHKMMAKRPEQRYQNASELLRDVRSLKLDGQQEDWPIVDDEWSTTDMPTDSDGMTEATRQLASVMRQKTARPIRPVMLLGLFGLIAAAASLGGLFAWARRPPPLLAVSQDELPVIQRQPTVREQFFHAAQLGTKDAWESVARYFPPQESEQNNYYALRSEQRLAEMDLERGDLSRAAERYQRLLESEMGDDEFRAIALAGLANVDILRDEQSQAYRRLAALGLLLDDLPPEVRQLIRADIDPRLRPEFERLSRDLRAEPQP